MSKLILAPIGGEPAYKIAAETFSDMYYSVTGERIPVSTEDDGVSELIVIGNDAVNDFLVSRMLDGRIAGFGIRYGTDDYCIRTVEDAGRRVLILAGGRGRSTIYAVYDFFERQAGCHYFWDGDVIPKAEKVSLDTEEIFESPRFALRGLRYFAHRGLWRFQAEHWSLEDWKREIDWMVKRRLNFFMLRIGMDDLWQRVFPDEVSYPDPNETHLDKAGYRDRSVFWPLEYRGILRKKLMEYALERDLVHPEDCGTMTHWYSPTPEEFLESNKHNVALMPQADNQYNAPQTQIWDITKKESMDTYMQLTEGYVREYHPNANLFHTIGMAERNMMPDRASNLRLKLFAYRKIAQSLREKFPTSKLLIASWDFVGWWESEEVQALVRELDPERTIIFDYTSDIDDHEQSFLHWGLIGKFPWIFGIFHAYEPESSLRGPYDRYDERLSHAVDDPMCQGMVFWPELSHSDPLVLEYLTENSWKPLTMNIEQIAERYCNRRYGESACRMNDIWQAALPIIEVGDWGGFTNRDESDPEADKYSIEWDVHREMWFNYEHFLIEKTPKEIRHYNFRLDTYRNYVDASVEILENLAALTPDEWNSEFILRDGTDLARTVIGRYMNNLLMKAKVCEAAGEREKIPAIRDTFLSLMNDLIAVLGKNPDFSLYHSLERLNSVCPVNKNFEHTLKGNLIWQYNRQYAYEPVKYLYIKECELTFTQLMSEERLELGDKFQALVDEFMTTPLDIMKPDVTEDISTILTRAAGTVRSSKEIL